ncbi:cob(I)yrinic acid a,c-diamide adenosyltransferase [Desulfovibrio legallii]|jgi:cob(I)alamin adenosyltransferase|uniref:corrinoid adenosyltransferase n=1 Tax=Desulfovibrio legallii TaxID=571438 RepID=A0A1G7IYW8_9BACT|nr:cob(I)yrinic acid a,c-diamide adenosyltransferase [Desulfovibrio legallii]SDF17897.1 cob(I)yrinic acid a,c-diamide adenosyltransferase [Desulfovibrio legallii]
MILVYTGDGKGKTSACVGQAVRALGQNLRVAFGQFMKRDGQAGEQALLAQWLGPRFLAGGPGFLRREEDRPAHREAALRVLDWAKTQLKTVDLLVLDEALYALKAQVLTRQEVEELLALARANECHLVLSGRNAPDWLVQAADLVTSMTEIKHPWRTGVTATAGIEY